MAVLLAIFTSLYDYITGPIEKEARMFILIVLLFLLICGGMAALTILNFSTQVHIVLLSWQSPDLPIGMWILIAFFLGALLLYLVSVVSAWSDQREIKKLRKHILALQQQLAVATPPAATSNVTASDQTREVPTSTPNSPLPMPNSPPPTAMLRNGHLMFQKPR
jgi:uncharacterized integral membrane protein